MSSAPQPATPPRQRGNRGRRGGRVARTPGGRPQNGQTGQIPTPAAATASSETRTEAAQQIPAIALPAEDENDGEVCFICASPVIHIAVAPCNHRTCHICSLRLRALYKTKACAHCRTNADYVIFTDEDKDFEDLVHDEIAFTDSNLGIYYKKKEIHEDTLLLLRYNCPDPSCDVACLGWPDLHRHVKATHHKVMCDLCTRNKKVFTHEHELFTKEELRRHEDKGDDRPGTADQSGFRGHPKCGFCRQHFYGDDELYTHCREKHERCHICDRRNQGRQPQYYLNYNALEEHFRKDHFVCLDQECLDKKFVVFESEMDLKAHQVEAHPNGLTKDARRVDLSDFSYRERYQPDRGRRDGQGRGRGRGEGSDRGQGQGRDGGRGRGRDPNSEPLPISSAQPLRRDELAMQRQVAIQTAQSVSGRTFGGQLSMPAPTPADASRATPTSKAVTSSSSNSFPSLGEVERSLPSQASTQLTKEQEARQRRHHAVVERASNMLRSDQAKLGEFRDRISSFKNDSITAPEMIESFFSLFDSTSAELGKLIKELADIFEIASKRDALLKAWNDWKAINEDYPSLPGSTSSSSTVTGGSHGGNRVLKLKSSTAQSSRSSVNRTASWGTTPTTGLFPSLSKRPAAAAVSSSSSSSSKRTARPTTTPWAGASGTPSPLTSQPASRSSSQRGARAPGTALSDSSAFPSLPPAAKPTSTMFTPGHVGHGVRRINGIIGADGANVNAWAGRDEGSTVTAEAVVGAPGEADEEPIGGRRKGNKNKKQMLMRFG